MTEKAIDLHLHAIFANLLVDLGFQICKALGVVFFKLAPLSAGADFCLGNIREFLTQWRHSKQIGNGDTVIGRLKWPDFGATRSKVIVS